MSVHINCCECGIDFCLPRAREQQLRESHQWFYCPNGHQQYFPQKTKQEKRIEILERHKALYIEDSARRYAEYKERTMEFAEGLRECPAGCDWRSPCHIKDHYNFGPRYLARVRQSVATHLAAVHGTELSEEVL